MSPEIEAFELAEAVEAIRAGDRSPGGLVDTVCDRIRDHNRELHAVLTEPDRRSRLREDLSVVEREIDGPDADAPLYGIPVGIKDIIQVDGFETRAGSHLPPEVLAGPEASCVRRLRDAGALIAGKTVTTEFAGPSAPGLTRNPHDTDHTPGGSSSGSAAGVAAGMFPLALGSQTGGSVIRPAAYCGIVGFKPSFERIPRDGVIPCSPSVDHVGMFTQDLAGMRIASRVLCTDWDEVTGDGAGALRVGVPQDAYLDHATDAGQEAFASQRSRLESAGIEVDPVDIPAFEEFERLNERFKQMTLSERAMVHYEWFDEYESFYRVGSAREIEAGLEMSVEALEDGRAIRGELRTEFEELMEDHGLDAWASPPAPGPAPAGIKSIGSGIMNSVWTSSGLPAVTIPDESVHGLPIGLQLIASIGSDERLLDTAGTVVDAL